MIFFKFPFNNHIYTVEKNLGEDAVTSFISFDETKKIVFNGKLEIISEANLPVQSSADLDDQITHFIEESKDAYLEKLNNVIDYIKKNALKKLVISRQKFINFKEFSAENSINLTKTFTNLCENYPNAFVYFFIKNQVCWMGAFSEVLGKFNKKTSEFETMSLAGTIVINDDWTEKEIEEQKPVTQYIQTILKKYSSQVFTSQTYDHISGNIKHLRNDFKAKINPENLENIIAELHPTPAVCGIPKDFCKNAIANFEKYPRELYAGYIRIEDENNVHYFVNLRCAKFYKNGAKIFVGGGITSQSNPEKEWQETELKSEAIQIQK